MIYLGGTSKTTFKYMSKEIKFMKLKRVNKLNFFKADYKPITNSLGSIDWNLTFQNSNIDEAVEVFYSTINKIIMNSTPMSKSTPNQYPIWYSRELINILNEKEIYYRLKSSTEHPIFIALHKQKRTEFKRLKNKCLRDYETNIESKLKVNPKCFFAYTKPLKKSNNLPPVMKYKNNMSENLKDTTNLFAQYFSSVYSNSNNTNTDFQCHNNCSTYFPISIADIESIINSLDQNKVSSPEGIPTIFYKNTLNNITKPLLFLFKLSLSAMQYPTKWKISHIKPIHKNGDTTNV